MANCYLCGEEITESNKSKEHIIPNALGGKLTSYEIWCNKCCDTYGTIDSKLIEMLRPIATICDIQRDRGDNKPFTAKIPDGSEVVIEPDGKIYLKKPIFRQVDSFKYEVLIGGKDRNQIIKNLRQFLKGKQRSLPEMSDEKIEAFLSKAEVSQAFPDIQPINFKLSLGGNEVERACTKIALHILLNNSIRPATTSTLIDYIKTGKSDTEITILSIEHSPIIESCPVTNSYVIIGNKSERILYVYLDLLSTYPCLSIIDREYNGPDISQAYEHNVVTNETRYPEIIKVLNKEDILSLPNRFKKENFKIMEARLASLAEFYQKKYDLKYPNSYFTEQKYD